MDIFQSYYQLTAQGEMELQTSYVVIQFEAGEPRETAIVFSGFRLFLILCVWYEVVKILKRS